MKTLLVLRHAKSSRSDLALHDHERPLNERGRRDAPGMGWFVREHGLMPHLVISSDAVRTQMTAEAFAAAARYRGHLRLEPQLYLASAAEIVEVLQGLRDRQTDSVMIVGHNPGLEHLVERLTGESQELPTAALAHIVLALDRWRDLTLSTPGTLVGCWRPADFL
jgi:phosphohistidine phosphatase